VHRGAATAWLHALRQLRRSRAMQAATTRSECRSPSARPSRRARGSGHRLRPRPARQCKRPYTRSCAVRMPRYFRRRRPRGNSSSSLPADNLWRWSGPARRMTCRVAGVPPARCERVDAASPCSLHLLPSPTMPMLGNLKLCWSAWDSRCQLNITVCASQTVRDLISTWVHSDQTSRVPTDIVTHSCIAPPAPCQS